MNKSILLVEDDQNISFAISLLLQEEGYSVYQAENGIAALDHLKKHGTPHLILLDMIMPGMDGWQFAKEFTKLYDSQVPILVMSAAGDVEQRAKDIGANGWIGKPFALDDLLAQIRKHELS